MLLAEKLKSFPTADVKHHRETGTKKAKVISICSQKGGVGKTTTAVNVSAAIARDFEQSVLVIDLDPQGHVEKSLCSLVPDGVDYAPISEILKKKHADILDAVIQTEWPNLTITPGDKALYDCESSLAAKIGREFIVKNAIALARTHYDLIFFDCPPNLGTLTLNALVASDYCIIPCEMSVLSFEGVSDLIETLELVSERLNPDLDILGVLFTRVDLRNIKMNELIEHTLQEYFKGHVFKTRITVNTDLNKAQLEGEPIFAFSPSASGSTNYRLLAEEVMRKLRKVK